MEAELEPVVRLLAAKRFPFRLQRVRALGGGVAVQNRMAFQGEHFVERYGADAARESPPIRRMLDMGIAVGAGTDATRVSGRSALVTV